MSPVGSKQNNHNQNLLILIIILVILIIPDYHVYNIRKILSYSK